MFMGPFTQKASLTTRPAPPPPLPLGPQFCCALLHMLPPSYRSRPHPPGTYALPAPSGAFSLPHPHPSRPLPPDHLCAGVPNRQTGMTGVGGLSETRYPFAKTQQLYPPPQDAVFGGPQPPPQSVPPGVEASSRPGRLPLPRHVRRCRSTSLTIRRSCVLQGFRLSSVSRCHLTGPSRCAWLFQSWPRRTSPEGGGGVSPDHQTLHTDARRKACLFPHGAIRVLPS